MKAGFVFTAILMIFISGCGWLREATVDIAKSSSRLREENAMESAYQLTESSNAQFLHIQRDSLDVLDEVMVLPKGKFSLSPEKGFEGEAEIVYITKKKKRGKELLNRGAVQQQTDQQSAVAAKQSKVFTEQKKEKTKHRLPVFRWWMLLIVLPLGWAMINNDKIRSLFR